MKNILALLMVLTMGLAACTNPSQLGPDGKPVQRIYRVGNAAQAQFRMLDAMNSLRAASGAGPVAFNSRLNAAAATHSRDMSVQNRPWHFGSDGSSPLERVQRIGYVGTMLGENISETYESELQTLAAWMQVPGTRDVILDPDAVNIGFSWYQEPNGKIWWTLITGNNIAPDLRVTAPVAADLS